MAKKIITNGSSIGSPPNLELEVRKCGKGKHRFVFLNITIENSPLKLSWSIAGDQLYQLRRELERAHRATDRKPPAPPDDAGEEK